MVRNVRGAKPEEDSTVIALACHFAFWIGPLFATPLFIAWHNPDDAVVAFDSLLLWAAGACLLLSLLGWQLSRLAGSHFRWWLNRGLLAAAFLMAIQGNVVHDLFYYGAFNGEAVNFRAYGWLFWSEWLGWLAASALLIRLFAGLPRLPAWLPALPVISALMLLSTTWSESNAAGQAPQSSEIESSVFAFSSLRNLVHLLPDGLQGDVVREVFEADSVLATRFDGFTLYTDHVGMYPGTAPALYTLLTGKAFDFGRGFSYDWVVKDFKDSSYQNDLSESGYQIDYVPISAIICVEAADSCHPRPFNDMKARGYARHQAHDTMYSIRLIADLTLFRLLPMFLKEQVYNEGRWLLADTTMDGSSPWPDPVIREWTGNLYVVDDRPVYKWYHYLGTHIPAKWGGDCRLLSEPSPERPAFVAQASCILNSIATLIDRMKEAGVYDQSAFLITGDHGSNLVPDDLVSPPLNSDLDEYLIGAGRPALLVKTLGSRHPLQFSTRPTHLLDLAGTARQLAGLEDRNPSIFNASERRAKPRPFLHYSMPHFWTGNPIPYVEYAVGQPAREGSQWRVAGIHDFGETPGFFDPINRPTAKGFVLGARLRKSLGNNKSSWITGRQLAFVIGLDGPVHERALELTMQFPEWMPGQSFTVEVNGSAPSQRWFVSPGSAAAWQNYSIPLDPGLQRPGRNFVSIRFDRVYPSPDDDELQSAGRIASIRVVEAAAP
jgi:hypothetical protein